MSTYTPNLDALKPATLLSCLQPRRYEGCMGTASSRSRLCSVSAFLNVDLASMLQTKPVGSVRKRDKRKKGSAAPGKEGRGVREEGRGEREEGRREKGEGNMRVQGNSEVQGKRVHRDCTGACGLSAGGERPVAVAPVSLSLANTCLYAGSRQPDRVPARRPRRGAIAGGEQDLPSSGGGAGDP